MPNYKKKTKAKLIKELQDLQQKYNSTLVFYEKENEEIKRLNKELICAKEKAEISERNYKLLFESTGTANSIFDTNCNLILQNELSRKFLDRGEAGGVGLSVFEIFGEQVGEDVFNRMKRVINTGIYEIFETEFNLPSGINWFRSTYQPVFDEDKNVISVQVISQNITEIKRKEKELIIAKEQAEVNEKKFRSLVWDMRVGVLLQGSQAEMLLSNPAALALLGLTEDQLMGKTSFDPYWNVIHEDGSPFPGPTHPVPVAIAERHSVRNVVMGVYRPEKKDRVWLLVDAIPQFDENGKVQQVVCTFINITELKHAELLLKNKNDIIEAQNEELLQINDELQHAKEKTEESEVKLKELNAEKDKFLSIVAHDLKSPFNSFLGLTQIMAEELPSLSMDEIKEITLSMRNSACNLYRLLENLLQWARIQQKTISFNPNKFILLPVIEESISITEEPAKKKGIELSLDIPEGLAIFADSLILQTIVRNLVSNAVKFTPKGGKISIRAKAVGDKDIEISIADSGIGMDQSMLDNLFRIDVQTSRKGTEDEPGTGLGLLLCKEFVEKHGGKIWVESELGKGSVFKFILPKG